MRWLRFICGYVESIDSRLSAMAANEGEKPQTTINGQFLTPAVQEYVEAEERREQKLLPPPPSGANTGIWGWLQVCRSRAE